MSLIVYLESGWLMLDYGTSNPLNTTAFVEYLWYHVSIVIEHHVYDKYNFKLFFNGTMVLNDTSDDFVLSPSYTNIYLAGTVTESSGDYSDLLDTAYGGLMQDIGIFSRSLTVYEISMLAVGTNSLSGATFLPRCICAPDEGVENKNEEFCENEALR